MVNNKYDSVEINSRTDRVGLHDTRGDDENFKVDLKPCPGLHAIIGLCQSFTDLRNFRDRYLLYCTL